MRKLPKYTKLSTFWIARSSKFVLESVNSNRTQTRMPHCRSHSLLLVQVDQLFLDGDEFNFRSTLCTTIYARVYISTVAEQRKSIEVIL